MTIPFHYAPDRPEHIEQLLNCLERYNPESTVIFQDYVLQQCEQQTYDCVANLALLKLYQFNPALLKEYIITNILVKALTVFLDPDFSLCLSLLPPHILMPSSKVGLTASSNNPVAGNIPFSYAVQKLCKLYTLLSSAKYAEFWKALATDPVSADLVAPIFGFENIIRMRIVVAVSQCYREIDRHILESWVNVRDAAFDEFITEVCGWSIHMCPSTGKLSLVRIPLTKENEAKSVLISENVKFQQFSRIVRRSYEQPA